MQNIVVLGGGISGLSTTHALLKKFSDSSRIFLVDRNPNLGGWVQSSYIKSQSLVADKGGRPSNKFLFDLGPRSIRGGPDSFHTLKLICDLGISEQVLFPDDAEIAKRK
jgi:protoporphyrinogen oxidase